MSVIDCQKQNPSNSSLLFSSYHRYLVLIPYIYTQNQTSKASFPVAHRPLAKERHKTFQCPSLLFLVAESVSL